MSMGTAGLEPARLSALDPKSSLSANSSTSPALCLVFRTGVQCGGIISQRMGSVNTTMRLSR